MPKERLKKSLDELREELNSESLDDESREMLETLAEELEDVLHPEKETGTPFGRQVRSRISRFEARHPALARILEDVVDTLSAMGI